MLEAMSPNIKGSAVPLSPIGRRKVNQSVAMARIINDSKCSSLAKNSDNLDIAFIQTPSDMRQSKMINKQNGTEPENDEQFDHNVASMN